MKSLAELQAIRENAKKEVDLRKEHDGFKVVVGMATCGISAGARPVMSSLLDEVQKRNLSNVVVQQTGCIGMCRLEPIVEVFDGSGEKVTYVMMDAEKAKRLVSEHIVNNKIVLEYTIGYFEQQENKDK